MWGEQGDPGADGSSTVVPPGSFARTEIAFIETAQTAGSVTPYCSVGCY